MSKINSKELLKDFRNKMDDIDKELQDLLAKRMKLSEEIGKYKLESDLPILNRNRELEILNRIKGPNSDKIREIYEVIFEKSKKTQVFDYFLVGKTLSYSFSPIIYNLFGLNNYKIYETDDFKSLDKINFTGINVTNPYKSAALNKCSELTPIASQTKAVNLILKKNNTYFGDNTDYFGFRNLIKKFKVEIKNKNILIIGNGDTARMVKVALADLSAKTVVSLARSPRGMDEYNLKDYKDYLDVEVIINTTPYGTYPSMEKKALFPLTDFSKLEAVIDLIYNPLRSPTLIEADKMKVKTINGLYMLVCQAAKNVSYFLNSDKTALIEDVYKKMLKYQLNFVLIGMPFVGKSFLGDKLSKLFSKKYIDVDTELEKKKFDLKTILKTSTLEDYRQKEAEETNSFAKEWNQVISTGGGIVLNDEVMTNLRRNGIIIFLNEDLDSLYSKVDNTRPLVKSKEDLKRLYDERIALYNKYADVLIEDSFDIAEITEKIYEYINTKWS
jgi:shikimate dehydrogenase